MRRRLAFALAGVAIASSRVAGAVEREHHVGLDAGGTVLDVADKGAPDVGAGIGAHYAYGLSDAFNFMAEGSWSLVSLDESSRNASTPRTRPTNLGHVGVGVGYVFDVLRWVPYAGVLAGAYALDGGTIGGTRVLPGVAAGLGMDYRIERNWAAGVAVRWHFLVTDMSTYPSLVDVFARVEYTWGW